MTLEMLFKVASFTVMPFWILLLVAPRWRWTQRLVHGPVVVLLLTPIYAYMSFGFAPIPKEVSLLTLYGVMAGFSIPHIVVGGWIHYLVFDLFIGAWESRDALRRGVPYVLVIPCLIGTLMAGPVGLLLYVVVRFFSCRALEFDEHGTA